MTRRHSILTLGGAVGAAASGYVWSERRGLIRADLSPEAPSTLSPQLSSLLTYASLAPSGHNAQPWRVTVDRDHLCLGSDRARWLPMVDPHNRELALSMGAFLENLLIAAPCLGYRATFEVVGAGPSDDDLVTVALAPMTSTGQDALPPLRLRRTVRTGQLSQALSKPDAATLTSFFGPGAQYFAQDTREGRYLAEATIEANRAQARRNDAQAELASWMRLTTQDARAHRDGLTQESMEVPGFAGWYVRHFLGRDDLMSQSFRDQGVERVQQQVASCAGWLVVTSSDSSLISLLETGRKTERMWLAMRDRKIGIHSMTQVLEERPFCDEAPKQIGIAGPIQFILRVGYVTQYPEPVSLRRTVSAMLAR
ncbi:MAG: nitroreductase [Acidobacteria bacterium]|nr:nitroreductase [Acidobacteriota bacterium]